MKLESCNPRISVSTAPVFNQTYLIYNNEPGSYLHVFVKHSAVQLIIYCFKLPVILYLSHNLLINIFWFFTVVFSLIYQWTKTSNF